MGFFVSRRSAREAVRGREAERPARVGGHTSFEHDGASTDAHSSAYLVGEGDVVEAGDEVGASIALLDIDDTHDLVPSDSSSWEVDATAYPSFQRAVIAKLVSMGVL